MHEGTYPRADARSSLCEMGTADYFPSKAEEDRALFLDLFLIAQERLVFSYQRLHSEDAKQQGPSLLIDELNQYLIKRGVHNGIVPIDHPTFPYDSVYFSPSYKVKKWSNEDYCVAKAHHFSKKETRPFFDAQRLASDLSGEIVIDIRQIKKLARHPFQFYLNETLKIYLKEEEDEEEKEFILSYLRKAVLRKQTIKSALPLLLSRLGAKGRLPTGLFMDTALQEIEEEAKELSESLAAFEIAPDLLNSVRFSPLCQEQEQTNAIFPQLRVPLREGRVAYITGTLEDVTPKGLVLHGRNDLKTLIRAWPLYLISLCLNPEGSKLFLTKSGEMMELPLAEPLEALSMYLDYFLLAKNSPSPLMPDWAEALLLKTEVEFSKVVSKRSSNEDVYLDYLDRRGELFDAKSTFSMWNMCLNRVFAPLIDLFSER